MAAPVSRVHCCWVCSVCPRGEVKPECGGQGWKGTPASPAGAKRGLVSVLNNIVQALHAGQKKHGLLFKRGMLADKHYAATQFRGAPALPRDLSARETRAASKCTPYSCRSSSCRTAVSSAARHKDALTPISVNFL